MALSIDSRAKSIRCHRRRSCGSGRHQGSARVQSRRVSNVERPHALGPQRMDLLDHDRETGRDARGSREANSFALARRGASAVLLARLSASQGECREAVHTKPRNMNTFFIRFEALRTRFRSISMEEYTGLVGIRWILIVVLLANTVLAPVCMAFAHQPAPAEDRHDHHHCVDCLSGSDAPLPDAGCAGHCLLQARSVASAVGFPLFMPTSAAAFPRPFLVDVSYRARAFEGLGFDMPPKLPVTTVVLRL